MYLQICQILSQIVLLTMPPHILCNFHVYLAMMVVLNSILMLRYISSFQCFNVSICYSDSILFFVIMIFQVFEESTRDKIFNISFTNPTFILKKLPSDTKLIIKVNIISPGKFSISISIFPNIFLNLK